MSEHLLAFGAFIGYGWLLYRLLKWVNYMDKKYEEDL